MSKAASSNEAHFRDGRGWLPARLVDPVGDQTDLEKAARPIMTSLEGAALELFRTEDPGTLAGSAYFPRHWKLERTMREWARTDAHVAAGVDASDRKVQKAVRQAFADLGFTPEQARMRAGVTFAAGLGFLHMAGDKPSPLSASER